MRRLWLLLVLLALGACAPGPADTPDDALAQRGALRVVDAQARLMGDVGAVYLTVINDGAADRLVRVTSPSADTIEAHQSVDDGGVMRMVPRPEGLEVPAGGSLELSPGGSHLMLIGPHLAPDATTIPLVLSFDEAGDMDLDVPVEIMGQPTAPHEHAPDHDQDSQSAPRPPVPPKEDGADG